MLKSWFFLPCLSVCLPALSVCLSEIMSLPPLQHDNGGFVLQLGGGGGGGRGVIFQTVCPLLSPETGSAVLGNYYTGQKKKKNHPCDASCDIEESVVWFRCDASMREVAAVASRVRSRFRSWIKPLDSLISQDSDFMHQQHGSFFVQGSSIYLLLPLFVSTKFCPLGFRQFCGKSS